MSLTKKQDLTPDLLVRSTDLWFRIRTKMSRIHNTAATPGRSTDMSTWLPPVPSKATPDSFDIVIMLLRDTSSPKKQCNSKPCWHLPELLPEVIERKIFISANANEQPYMNKIRSIPDSPCCCSMESSTVLRERSPSSVRPFTSSARPGIHLV